MLELQERWSDFGSAVTSQFPKKSLRISCRWMANFTLEGWKRLHHLTREIHMNTTDSTTSRVRRFAAIAIVGALALSFAVAFAALKADNATGDGIFAQIGDYISQVGEALEGG